MFPAGVSGVSSYDGQQVTLQTSYLSPTQVIAPEKCIMGRTDHADCKIGQSPENNQHLSTIPAPSTVGTSSTLSSTSLETSVGPSLSTSEGTILRKEQPGFVKVHTFDNSQNLSKESSNLPLPTSQIVYIKPVLKPQVFLKPKTSLVVPSTSSPSVSSERDKEEEVKVTTASRIIYISLLPYPTKSSKPKT